MENLTHLVKTLCRESAERPWVEFKHDNYTPELIGRSISALANGAALVDKARGYMVWGVEDGTYRIVGTKHDLQNIKKGREELEGWLRHLLSPNADFEFGTCTVDGKRVGVLAVEKASRRPVTFEKTAYIRIGSYTKGLRDLPSVEARLWNKLLAAPFEGNTAKADLELGDALALLGIGHYYDILGKHQPSTASGIAHDMLEEGLLLRQDNGLYAVTNLGAILLAKRLEDFPGLSRKGLRVVQYRGDGRTERIREFPPDDGGEGYAMALGNALTFIGAALPAREEIIGAERVGKTEYPPIALREAVANALIHQDFSVSGTGPTVELFDRRIEITNPGALGRNRPIDRQSAEITQRKACGLDAPVPAVRRDGDGLGQNRRGLRKGQDAGPADGCIRRGRGNAGNHRGVEAVFRLFPRRPRPCLLSPCLPVPRPANPDVQRDFEGPPRIA